MGLRRHYELLFPVVAFCERGPAQTQYARSNIERQLFSLIHCPNGLPVDKDLRSDRPWDEEAIVNHNGLEGVPLADVRVLCNFAIFRLFGLSDQYWCR
jgi:hypothetical protein